jgi:hypothetical protein
MTLSISRLYSAGRINEFGAISGIKNWREIPNYWEETHPDATLSIINLS